MKKKDSILIAGIGAVGSILYTRLKLQEQKLVCLTSKRGTKKIRKKGISVKLKTDLTPTLHKAEVYEFLPSKFKFKHCIVSTKAYNNQILADYLPDFMQEKASILLFQNGMGVEEPFLQNKENWFITRAVSSLASYRNEKDFVVENATGRTSLGAINHNSSAILEFWRNLLNSIGLATIIPANFHKTLCKKVIASSTLNPIGMITKLKNGKIIEDKQLLRIVGNIIHEILLIMEKEIDFNYSEIFNYVLEIAKTTSENKCSMLQDFEKGVKTEIDYFNGYFVEKAKEKNIESPINNKLLSIVKKLTAEEIPDEIAILELRSLM